MRERRLTYQGETLSLTKWAARLGISRQALLIRLKSGVPLEQALTTLSSEGRATLARRAYVDLLLECKHLRQVALDRGALLRDLLLENDRLRAALSTQTTQ